MEQGVNPNYLSPTEVANRKSSTQLALIALMRWLKRIANTAILLLLLLSNLALVVTAIFALLTLKVKSDIISIALVVLILAVLNYTLMMNRRELNAREFATKLRR